MPIPRSSVLLLIALLAAGGAALGYVFLWPRHSGDGTAPATASAPSSPTPAVEWFVDAAARGGSGFRPLQRNVRCVSTTPSTWAPEWRCSTTTTTAISMSFSLKVGCSGQARSSSQALFPPKEGRRRKDGCSGTICKFDADGTRTLRFTDVTEASGSNATGYGMGVAAGDYDNDGCIDLYVTTLGRNQMFRNNCNGTFTDVSKASGTDDQRMERVGGVRRLRSRWLARPVRRPLPELQLRMPTRCATAWRENRTTARRTFIQPNPATSFTTTATARSPM